MSGSIRIHIARSLSLFLALYILNFSLAIVPCPTNYQNSRKQNAADMHNSDNLLETFLEISFDLTNPLPEPAENQQEAEKEPESPDLFSFGPSTALEIYLSGLESQAHSKGSPNPLSLLQEVCSPPPKC